MARDRQAEPGPAGRARTMAGSESDGDSETVRPGAGAGRRQGRALCYDVPWPLSFGRTRILGPGVTSESISESGGGASAHPHYPSRRRAALLSAAVMPGPGATALVDELWSRRGSGLVGCMPSSPHGTDGTQPGNADGLSELSA
jgi:hypothetical protein